MMVPFLRSIAMCLLASAPALLAAPASAGLPKRIVSIDDADRDGRYTGADVSAAIVLCKPGCILQALPQQYSDVEATLGPELTEGVVLQGAGIGKTVFRARVPQGGPVLRVAAVPATTLLRDFTVDGRKQEQTRAALSGDGSGIAIASPWRTTSAPGIVERVEAAHLITAGVIVRDGSGWEIRDSQIHDIGCNADFPCPRLTAAAPDPIVPGRLTVGYGISVVDADARGTVVHHNRIWNISKIGIEAYRYTEGRAPTDFWFHHNHVSRAADSGITSNQGMNGRIEHNTVERCGGSGIVGNLGAGITCEGDTGGLVVLGNTVLGNEGPGLRLGCKGPLTVESNLAQGNCTKRLGNFGEINANYSPHDGAALILRANTVAPTSDGSVCPIALVINGYRDVEVDGGAYRGGSLAGAYLSHSRNLVFRNTTIDGGAAIGIVIQPDVDGVQIEPSTVLTSSKALINDAGARNVNVSALGAASISAPGQPQPLLEE